MKLSKYLIALNKGFIICESMNRHNQELVYELQSLLMSNGYMLTQKAFNICCEYDEEELKVFTTVFKEFVRTKLGRVESKSIPQLAASGELGVTAGTSFLSWLDLIWSGNECTEAKSYYEHSTFKELDAITEEEFKTIFTNLVQINTALIPTDFKTVEWFAKEYGNDNIMPDSIPFKENLCMLAKLGLDLPVKTATDVLRIAFYMSTGKTDLILEASKVKASLWSSRMIDNPDKSKTFFKKFKRAERRYILSLLEKINPFTAIQEMHLKKGMWIQLGNIIHPGEYKSFYPKAFGMFDAIRNKETKSWYGLVDAAFSENFNKGLELLSQRPGEYARRLDALLRNNPKRQSIVLSKFHQIGKKISSKVLWELYTHFVSRTETNATRKIWIKGARKPTPLSTLAPMSQSTVDNILDCILTIFYNKFQEMEGMGRVFIDEELKKIPAPTNMRSLSESTVVTIRGTRMPLECDKPVLRMYVHWTKGVDLDLSMNFIGSRGNTSVCNYTNTKPESYISHSGDVIPRTYGKWAEYIDVNLNKVKKDYKYGLVTLRNFSGGALKDTGAIIGFMEREKLSGTNKSWYPESITSSYIPNSVGGNLNLFIVDFETMEWILVDEDVSGVPIENRNNIKKYVKELSELPKLSAYDILKLHVEARGQLVTEIENADKAFRFEDFSTSYESIAEYML